MNQFIKFIYTSKAPFINPLNHNHMPLTVSFLFHPHFPSSFSSILHPPFSSKCYPFYKTPRTFTLASIFFKIVTDEIPGQPNPGFTKQREDRTSPYFAQNASLVKLDDRFYDDPSKRQEKSLKYSELNIQPSFRYLIDLMHLDPGF